MNASSKPILKPGKKRRSTIVATVGTRANLQGRARVHQYLVQIAHQSGIADALLSEDAFRRYEISPILRNAFNSELRLMHLNETRFYVLVALYSNDPESLTIVDLAYYVNRAGATVRAMVANFVDKKLMIHKQGDGRTRESVVNLTDEGRRFIAGVIYRYLQFSNRI